MNANGTLFACDQSKLAGGDVEQAAKLTLIWTVHTNLTQVRLAKHTYANAKCKVNGTFGRCRTKLYDYLR